MPYPKSLGEKNQNFSPPKGTSRPWQFPIGAPWKVSCRRSGRQTERCDGQSTGSMYSAWDQSTQAHPHRLARKALAISPLCADAYVLLAEEDANRLKRP